MDATPQFHPFPRLPGELRLKIWYFALCTHRVVSISCRKSPFHRRTPEIPREVESFSSSTPVPALLHANRESRHEALAFYTAAFVTPRSQIYISFPHDSVSLSDNILVNVPDVARRTIRHLVLDVQDCEYFEFFNMECIRGMGALETLELQAHRGVRYNWSSGTRYVDRLMADFEFARRQDPEWNCPRVRIVNKYTLEQLALIDGGAGVYPSSDLEEDENEG
jgi:2EXR family